MPDNSETAPTSIHLLTSDSIDGDDQSKDIFNWAKRLVPVTLPTDLVKKNITSACGAVAEVLADIRAVGAFRLTEVTIALTIDAKGEVRIVGSASVGISGTITLKFAEA